MELRRYIRAFCIFAVSTVMCFAQSAGITNVTVTFSATPTFTANAGVTNFDITLSGNVTASNFVSAAVGVGSFKICQDSTGGRTFTWPGGALGFGTIDSTPSKCSRQPFKWDGSVLQATGAMVTDGTATGGVPGLKSGASLSAVTSVGSPGLDLNVPTEKAVRDAIAASGGGTMGSVTIAGTANQITVTGTCTGTTSISCTLSIPSVLTLPGSINKVTLTAPATGATLTLVDGKTLTASNTLTLAGTDGSTITFGTGGTVLYTTSSAGSFPTLNQNTTGTASNLSGTPALPNGTLGTTQSAADNSTKLATTAYADAAAAARFGTDTKNDVLQGAQSCIDSGSTDAYACNFSPAITAYALGARYRFRAATANTGPATFAGNGLSAITLKKPAGGITTDLADNDIRALQWVEFVYGGTNGQVVSQLGNAASGLSGDMLTATYNQSGSGVPSGACTAGSWKADTSVSPNDLYRCNAAGSGYDGPFSVSDSAHSGVTFFGGLTTNTGSGIGSLDNGGTAIVYYMPAWDGSTDLQGKQIVDGGAISCQTINTAKLPAGTVCHKLLLVDPTRYAAGAGTANAQTAAYTPAITATALTDGLRLCWKPTAANTTTTPTFSPDSLTAHVIVKATGALVANDLVTTAIACAIYNTTGTHWELQNPQTTPSGGGDVTTTGTNTYTSSAVNDARAAAHTLPAKTGTTSSIPGTCTVGEEYFALDATAGQNKYFCSATNTWTQQLNSGGGLTQTHSVSFVVYNNGSVLAAGNSYVGQLPAACTITGYSLAADASGSISIDLSAHANASQATAPAVPNTTTDKISASAPMILSSAQTNADTTLTGWSKTRAIWDSFLVNVTGTPATVTKVMGQVFCQ